MSLTQIVKTTHGLVKGLVREGLRGGTIYSFQGIPYAKPPLGDLRFKPPQEPNPWSGTLDATKEGNMCLQYGLFSQKLRGNEDCLYLNVFTPEIPQGATKRKPVMVWLHAGGLATGSGNRKLHGPDFLLTGDVVLVTLNYRLSVFGFLSLEDPSLNVPGNNGLRDMIQALKWTKDNIAEFGGDPDNITLFGSSAGSAAVHWLVLSPLTKGLVHKAILQSGYANTCFARGQKGMGPYPRLLWLGQTTEADFLRSIYDMPAKDLVEAFQKIYKTKRIGDKMTTGLVVENPCPAFPAVMSEEPMELLKEGQYNQVPMIVGYVGVEGMLSAANNASRNLPFNIDLKNIVENLVDFPLMPFDVEYARRKMAKYYLGNEKATFDDVDLQMILKITSHAYYFRRFTEVIRAYAETAELPVYCYRFTLDAGLNTFKINNKFHHIPGASHADEVGYLFNTDPLPKIEPGSVEDVSVDRMVKLWTSFARDGKPQADGNVEWKPITRTDINFLNIDKELTEDVNPESEAEQFWERLQTELEVGGY